MTTRRLMRGLSFCTFISVVYLVNPTIQASQNPKEYDQPVTTRRSNLIQIRCGLEQAGLTKNNPVQKKTQEPKGQDLVAAIEHWVIEYDTSNKATYAAQLDFFKIELGSLDKKTPEIEYAKNLSAMKPTYRKGSRKNEKRFYFKKLKNHPTIKWDKEFLQAAGAKIDDRYLFLFHPHETAIQLFKLDQDALARSKKRLSDVKRAVFVVDSVKGGGFAFNLKKLEFK